jgi:hypothetical protein
MGSRINRRRHMLGCGQAIEKRFAEGAGNAIRPRFPVGALLLNLYVDNDTK